MKFKSYLSAILTYGGLAVIAWQTNLIVAAATFCVIWGFVIHNSKEI